MSKRELPAPPAGWDGWPWETASNNISADSSADLPRISIVTPSFNQGKFIEQTIRSVLLQNYPNLEYIIIDGGSTDESVSIIRKYEPWLSYWVSERDRGQSHAINKGFAKATGQIICWLNSDDYFMPETLSTVGRMLADGTGNYVLAGHVEVVFLDGRPPYLCIGEYYNRRRLFQFWRGYHMHQAAIFWRREVFEKVGMLDENLHMIMDFDYWARISEHFDFVNINRVMARVTYHESAKTGDGYVSYYSDLRKHAHRYWGSRLSPEYWILKSSMINHFLIQPNLREAKKILRSKLSRLKFD